MVGSSNNSGAVPADVSQSVLIGKRYAALLRRLVRRTLTTRGRRFGLADQIFGRLGGLAPPEIRFHDLLVGVNIYSFEYVFGRPAAKLRPPNILENE